jgi:hypothetical protein
MTWMETYSALRYDFINPQQHTIALEDGAHSLGAINRFNGHTIRPYPVAQHSIAVALHIEETHGCRGTSARALFALAGLLHDFHEAYVGDATRPYQEAVRKILADAGITDQRYNPIAQIDYRARKAVAVAFDMPEGFQRWACVKDADNSALRWEASHLMRGGIDDTHWSRQIQCAPLSPRAADFAGQVIGAERAAGEFIRHYERLLHEAGLASIAVDHVDAYEVIA